ncbi:oligoribonuclease, partial [Candidatus Saccharibacteria bacterium]|nr:oligoribonuclease [Candidatus Saccharibacteria bacterium]
KIEEELITFVDKHFDKKTPVLLGGNSIHNDRQFIIAKWPDFNRKLHYRMLDVTAWKVVFSNKYKKVFMSSDSHRAIDDVRGSINEMKYYLSSVK